jgi:hypothetical protein
MIAQFRGLRATGALARYRCRRRRQERHARHESARIGVWEGFPTNERLGDVLLPGDVLDRNEFAGWVPGHMNARAKRVLGLRGKDHCFLQPTSLYQICLAEFTASVPDIRYL